ncbi:Uncharacterised protein [Mycoplasmopsis columbinasalis]|uniref:Uncharacterized protein n=1 Tax=Mycoplasmopsis columbinasalis TaxID=114880 RepID=A0A449BB51_9BACT|nr:Uncharacterised protein [Mycoplasmopsis columbinasalis]
MRSANIGDWIVTPLSNNANVTSALHNFFSNSNVTLQDRNNPDNQIEIKNAYIRFQKLVASHLDYANLPRRVPVLKIYFSVTFSFNNSYHTAYFIAQDDRDWADFDGEDVELKLSPDPVALDEIDGEYGLRQYLADVLEDQPFNVDTKPIERRWYRH